METPERVVISGAALSAHIGLVGFASRQEWVLEGTGIKNLSIAEGCVTARLVVSF